MRVIHNLPEEARKLLAGFFLLVAAVLLFNNWALSVSSNLASPVVFPPENESQFPALPASPGNSATLREETKSESVQTAPAPFASIADSVKSLEKLIKNPSADSSDSSESLSQRVKEKTSNSVAALYAVLEKTWKYIYDPFKK